MHIDTYLYIHKHTSRHESIQAETKGLKTRINDSNKPMDAQIINLSSSYLSLLTISSINLYIYSTIFVQYKCIKGKPLEM